MIRARDQAGGAMLMRSRHAVIAAVSRPQAHQRRSHLSNSGSISCGKSWSQVKERHHTASDLFTSFDSVSTGFDLEA
eukprot:756409-Rhodomonas_salina.2